MDRPGVRQVPESSGEPGKMEDTGCEIMCGVPTTLAFKGMMMMMMRITRKYSTTTTTKKRYANTYEWVSDCCGGWIIDENGEGSETALNLLESVTAHALSTAVKNRFR